MNQPASKDPSMDEILSSIRQIIADDEPAASEPPAAEQVQPAAALQAEAVVQEPEVAEPAQMAEPAPVAAPTPVEAAPAEEMPLALSQDQMIEPTPMPSAPEPAQMAEPAPLPTPALVDSVAPAAPVEEMPLALSQDQMIDSVPIDAMADVADDAGLMRAAPDPQEFANEFGADVSEDVGLVVPDDIAFISDSDDEEAEATVDNTDIESTDLDDLDGLIGNVDLATLDPVHPAEAPDIGHAATFDPEPVDEPQSPLPDKSLTTEMSDELLEPATQAAAKSAFGQLDALTLMGGSGQTVEDLIREMLRPMLKGWLDENLPGVVEKLVQREIERVSRGNK
ncbi:DUF2497 domain-containing protein [Maritalea sp.]|uniref:DUF2497 domain-containing protein n=1 Tax=Maritalea sp. TaxID=2003361 RepID=UPI003EFA1115